MPTFTYRLPLILTLCLVAPTGCGGGASMGNGNANANVNANDNENANTNQCGVGDDEKGLSGAPKIYHGTALPEQCLAPRQQLAVGALLFQDGGWSNGCTGTLIADDAVLTAAHCVAEGWQGDTIAPSSVRFAIGRDAADPDHTFSVASVHMSSEYGGGDAANDVGLLVLSEGVTAAGAQALPIPVNRTALTSGLVGAEVQNGGYGATETNDDNTLRFWTVEEVSAVETTEFTVYGGGYSSVCWGDSGGPSLHLWEGRKLALLGTVSWGDESCMDYDHFCRADDNLGFIEGITGALDPCVGIDADGLCDGDVAIWCESGTLVQQCCGASGTSCAANGSGQSRCTGACGGETYLGRCEGTDAVWCEGGEVRRRRCAPCGQVCGDTGTSLGFYCVDPA